MLIKVVSRKILDEQSSILRRSPSQTAVIRCNEIPQNGGGVIANHIVPVQQTSPAATSDLVIVR